MAAITQNLEHLDGSPLGFTRPDPLGELLGTAFLNFSSPTGLCGLAREVDGGIELLAVDAHPPGCGQFREFIRRCKAHYSCIVLLEIWNPALKDILARYGFKDWCEVRDHEFLTGMKWTREDNAMT